MSELWFGLKIQQFTIKLKPHSFIKIARFLVCVCVRSNNVAMKTDLQAGKRRQ
jgi:hypothetical protein